MGRWSVTQKGIMIRKAQAIQAVFPLIATLIIITSDKQKKAELTSAYGSAFRS